MGTSSAPRRLRRFLACFFAGVPLYGCAPTVTESPSRPALVSPSTLADDLTIAITSEDGLGTTVGFDLALEAEVGQVLRLRATASGGERVDWRIAPEDRDKAKLTVLRDIIRDVEASSAQGDELRPSTVAVIELLKPGGIHVYAEAAGRWGEALLAARHPATASSQLPFPRVPGLMIRNPQHGSWLFTDDDAWDDYYALLQKGASAPVAAPAAPVDFAVRSLVLVLDSGQWDRVTGAWMATHLDPEGPGALELIQPRVLGYGAVMSPGHDAHVYTLLSVPAVRPGCRLALRGLTSSSP